MSFADAAMSDYARVLRSRESAIALSIIDEILISQQRKTHQLQFPACEERANYYMGFDGVCDRFW
ncbi:hypothetical protein I8748_07765 [Nostoc sp. CENA67]|uniref:Uncharacterized protein n=1 Tax=Amazonocrinis nigriterrae CENA67 TaxID=2794033 RepID=A0A8J7HR81_9NOST|nr:hypothetical protein [Amazonocrinis nigriterrae]MBH8562070.1 hypothetical protein [Amazonocrinis nigriterrae CENA67]